MEPRVWKPKDNSASKMPPNTHKRKETSWQIGRIFEAHLSLRAIAPRLLRYTWGFDEGRISDAHLYKLLSSIWTIGEAYTRTNTPRFIFSNDLFLSDSNKIKITTLLFVSLKQMSYLRDIMKKTSNNQPIITRFSKSTLCLFVMIFCPSTQGWKHCQPLRIF